MCAVAALKIHLPFMRARPRALLYRQATPPTWPAQRYFTQMRAMQLLVAGQGESSHHIANGGDVELQAWLEASPDSPADMTDLLPQLPLILVAQINDLLRITLSMSQQPGAPTEPVRDSQHMSAGRGAVAKGNSHLTDTFMSFRWGTRTSQQG